MPISRQPEPPPDGGWIPHHAVAPGDGPEPGNDQVKERPTGVMQSIQQFESPEDAEAQHTADQRTADGTDKREGEQPDTARGTARVQPDRARGTARVQTAGPRADVQTTTGVPKTPLPPPPGLTLGTPGLSPRTPGKAAAATGAAGATPPPAKAPAAAGSPAAENPAPATSPAATTAAAPQTGTEAPPKVPVARVEPQADAARPAPPAVAPAQPAPPVVAGTPAQPAPPVVPGAPAQPAPPVVPGAPAQPAPPVVRGAPAQPAPPVTAAAPARPAPPAAPAQPGPPGERVAGRAKAPGAATGHAAANGKPRLTERVPAADQSGVQEQRPQADQPAAAEAQGRARVQPKIRGAAVVPGAGQDSTTLPPPTPTPGEMPPTRIPVVPGRLNAPPTPATPAPDPARAPKPASVRRQPLDLGHAPLVLALSSLGVLLVAFSYQGGRNGASSAMTAYWIGQVVVFTPVVLRLLSRRMAGVGESFLLVMGLAVNQYLLKWMYSPDQFRFPDELQHWLATTVLMETGKLFQPNPALPPAVHFPGLAEMAAGLSGLTGMPVTASGVIVAGVAHLVFVGVLFATALRASNSPAVAGVACALYATAMHYLFFNSMFLYQTAALPFFMLTIWATRRWLAEGGKPFAIIAVGSILVTTVSHHVTAFALVATLVLLAVADLVTQRPRRAATLVMPAVALAIVAAWILFVASDVIEYLEDPITQVIATVRQLLNDETTPEAASAAVSVGQLVVQGAGLLGLFVLYLACVRDMIHRHDRDSWRWAAVVGSFLFFAGNAVRFLGQNGPEISGRLQTFTYIPIAILSAIALVRGVQIIPLRDSAGHRWRAAAPVYDYPAPVGWPLFTRVAAGSALVTLLMIGARAGGWPPLVSLLPGPYLPGGFERSVDAYGVAAANWERETLGPDHRIGGDVTSVSLGSTYGRQDPVREVGPLFYADHWGLAEDDLATRVHLEYLVVDQRLTTRLPVSDAYFENDPRAGRITSPLTTAQIGKFDTLSEVDRVYDNGTVRIYHVGDAE
ncbi:hypothetical protein [Krasilnikovia sp. MM14-A1259]|uniref:hypothetical protein n=1 Tax=Krasilnikovia sp. MM14-A1259 TaxID=3373539 RepID=UPI003802BA92